MLWQQNGANWGEPGPFHLEGVAEDRLYGGRAGDGLCCDGIVHGGFCEMVRRRAGGTRRLQALPIIVVWRGLAVELWRGSLCPRTPPHVITARKRDPPADTHTGQPRPSWGFLQVTR